LNKINKLGHHSSFPLEKSPKLASKKTFFSKLPTLYKNPIIPSKNPTELINQRTPTISFFWFLVICFFA